MNKSIELMREELRNKIFDQGFHWKILFIGTSVNGTTDIVSSLSRSLRNLGHHVLDIDTARHRILDNPLRRQGGMGPIYVRYDKIETIVDSFQPQIIVCAAGGLTFSEEDAKRLKDRGVVLVGITLSDPDVFPTIQEHQHVFDLHTTNADIALDMYKSIGVNNTVYFPFGIDRGFVTQQIAENSDFDADVICLGHATKRPDRNSMMTKLAEKFDVRTYGRGWDIPNSVSVSGQEMVQALKGGRIHVNFPLTRAGYINIKCGVFESAGQGRLVATGKFDEMSKFFKYGEEIIGYEDDTDLANQIEFLLKNPNEYTRIAENGFRRVVENHLYEHRWMYLFDILRGLTNDNAAWLSAARLEQIQKTLNKSLPRAKKVIISGFYGARNLGDDMILRSISERLIQADPAIQVFVAAENTTHVESKHGLQSFERRNHSISAYQAKTATAIVLGGGGLWHDYTFERGGGLAAMFTGGTISMAGFGILPLMGKVLGIPFHVVGLGVGPLTEKYAKRTVRYLAEQADSLYVRDPESANLLREISVSEDAIHTGPDSVYAVDLNQHANMPIEIKNLKENGYTLVGVNLRPWSGVDMKSVAHEVRNSLISLNKEMIKEGKKIAVVALPMQAGDRMDRATISLATRTLPAAIPVVVLDNAGELSLEQYLGALSGCSVLLSMRLHAALIAHRVSVPVVGLCYDPKVRRHFVETDRNLFGLELNATSGQMNERMYEALHHGLSDEQQQKIRALEAGAVDSLSISVSAIAKLPPIAEVYEVPSENEAPGRKRPASAQIGANFQNITQKFHELPEMDKNASKIIVTGLHKLQVGMLTEQPLPGMRVEQHGVISLMQKKPSEIDLKLHSGYNNQNAKGIVYIEFEIGDQKFRQDLSETPIPVQIKITSKGKTNIPFTFRLCVEKSAFRARSWGDATTTTLEIVGVKAIPPNRTEALISSSGEVLPGPTSA